MSNKSNYYSPARLWAERNTNAATIKKMVTGFTTVLTVLLVIGVLIFGNAHFSATDFDYNKVGLLVPTSLHYADAALCFWASFVLLVIEFLLIKFLDVPGR